MFIWQRIKTGFIFVIVFGLLLYWFVSLIFELIGQKQWVSLVCVALIAGIGVRAVTRGSKHWQAIACAREGDCFRIYRVIATRIVPLEQVEQICFMPVRPSWVSNGSYTWFMAFLPALLVLKERDGKGTISVPVKNVDHKAMKWLQENVKLVPYETLSPALPVWKSRLSQVITALMILCVFYVMYHAGLLEPKHTY